MPRRSRPHAVARASLAAAALLAALTGCTATPGDPAATAAPDVVRVPADAPTITDAVGRVAEGGLVLVSPGTYPEQVLVETADVTIRGLDRGATVIDAEGIRPYGIVAVADGVSIENLTVTRATFYGVLVTGMHDASGPGAHGDDGYTRLDTERFPPVQRFSVSHVTASNNGLYGIYAFDAQHGVIRDSYASGSADSGFYVGQCRECDILVTGNVAEYNAVGFENANASDSVVVVGNRFSGNRVGMTFLSNYQEALAPQRGNTVVGNLVSGNTASDSPAQAEGAFGIGIGIGAGTDNLFARNRITGNPSAGVMLSSTEDLAPTGNSFDGNVFADNGVDLVNVASDRAPAAGNCVVGDAPRILPGGLLDGCAPGRSQPSTTRDALPRLEVPRGVSFLKVAPPPAQPQLPDPEAPARRLPDAVAMPDVASVAVPDAALLADRARA